MIVGAMLDNQPYCLKCGDELMQDNHTRRMIFLEEEHRLLVCVGCKKTIEEANKEKKP
mgnify:CR=1 FL=1